MKGKKVIIVILLIVASMVVTISTYKNFDGKKVEEVEEKSSKDNILTFHVQQDSGNYTEYTSGEFPGTNYQINRTNTTCTDVYGNKINTTIEYINGSIVVNGSKTVYCEIYLDKCKGAVGTVLEGKEKVSSCEVGGMYRYQGTNDVNNYICFGTTDRSTCTSNASKYMYRIIGVTPDNHLKLILDDFLRGPKGGYLDPPWGYADGSCGTNPSRCTWSNSYLFNGLNGTDTSVTDNFIGNNYYEYLNNGTWLNSIEILHTWKYGDIPDETQVQSYNGYEVYMIENAFTDVRTGPIGAPYIHDYLFAYPGGNPGNGTNAGSSWIANTMGYGNAWTMTRRNLYESSSDVVYRAYCFGNWGIGSDVQDPAIYVRPVFYLGKGITIKSGTGSSTDPYILNK